MQPRKLNVSDCDYFQVQRDQDGTGFYISVPFLPNTEDSHLPQIALSERLEDSNRHFAGIVGSTLRLSYFRQLFQDSILGRHDGSTLLRTD